MATESAPIRLAYLQSKGFVTNEISFVYTNHRGETEKRSVRLFALEYGVFPFHPEPCFALRCFCLDRQADRTFDLSKIDMATWEWL